MLTYEDLWDMMVSDAEGAGLEVYMIRNTMETTTCEREFRMFCAPTDAAPPYNVYAELGFVWEVDQTAASVYGPDCSFYHDEGEACPHQNAEPQGFVELEIRYSLGRPQAQLVPSIAMEIREVLQECIQHQNFPQIQFLVSVLPDDRVVIHEAYATYHWEIEFYDEPVDFAGIMEEVRTVLERLNASGLCRSEEDGEL